MEKTPLHNIQVHIEAFKLRVNYINNYEKNEMFDTQCLNIYIENFNQRYFMEESFVNKNLPQTALTIFGDISTIFQYLTEYYNDSQRVKIVEQGLLICNINKIKNKQIRQQVQLPMKKLILVEPTQSFSGLQEDNNDIKVQLKQVISQNCKLKQICNQFEQQMKILKVRSQQEEQKIKYIEQRLQQKTDVTKLQQKIFQINSIHRQQIQQMQNQQQSLVEMIHKLKRKLEEQITQRQHLQQSIKILLFQNKSKNSASNYKGDVLGQKINITIDCENNNLKNFEIQQNIIERNSKNDQTRFQILGNQVFGKINRSYFEIKILKLSSGNFLVGFVSSQMKGVRQSHNSSKCVCLQATGKVFDMGKKIPAISKLQEGQTVRILLDLQISMVRWYVGLTEICSVQIPDTFVNSKLVPYLQLNEKGDKIVLNG